MKRLTVAVGVSTGLVFLAGPVAAQYRYTDDKGVSKVTQYKLDVPKDYRDAAAWVGRTGIGKPALSEEARQTKLRDEAYRRIGAADAALVPYRAAEKAQQAEAARVNAVNQAAAKDRAQKQAIQKQEQTERRAERRADEALSLQRESVELERQRAHAEQIRLNNDTQRLLYRGR
jgi:hypothetical protein